MSTYLNVLIVEETEKFQKDLERGFDVTNDKLESISKIAFNNSMKVLSDNVYIPMIGDKLIKLSVQFVVRYLNMIHDKLHDKSSLSQERYLFIIEDLH